MLQDIALDMRVAAHKHLRAVLGAGLQHAIRIGPGVQPVASQPHGRFVQFEHHAVIGSRFGQLAEIDRIGAVVRMADDMHLRVFHGLQISMQILLLRAGGQADVMHAGDAVIQRSGKGFIQIDRAVQIHDVQFATEENLHAVKLTRNASAGAEIVLAGRAFHCRAMVGDAQQLYALFRGRARHFVNRIVRMAAGDGMRMDIQHVAHAHTSACS